jgi:hypothetical protein
MFSSYPFGFDPFGDEFSPLRKIRKNQKQLQERPQVHEIAVGKRLRTPIEGYRFNEGVSTATQWSGHVTEKLYRTHVERPIFQLSHKDGFRCVYELQTNHAGILVVYYPETNGRKLIRHMEKVGDLLFDHHGLDSVSARAHPPRIEGEMQGPDRREETVEYQTPSGWEKRSRLFKMWITVCKNMVPEDTGDSDAGPDELKWISPHFELNDEARELLNSKLPTHHRWLF